MQISKEWPPFKLGPTTGRYGLWAFLLLVCSETSAQVIVSGVTQPGTSFVDTPGTDRTGAAATIIRVDGAGFSYSGDDISGSTAATGNSFRGAEATTGGHITFTGNTVFTINGTAPAAIGLRANGAGSSISAEQVTITTQGDRGNAVDVQAGATANLGTQSQLTTNFTGANTFGLLVSGVGSIVTATDLGINAAFRAVSIGAGGLLELSGTGNAFQSPGVGVNVLGTLRVNPGGSLEVRTTSTTVGNVGVLVGAGGVVDAARLVVNAVQGGLQTQAGAGAVNLGSNSELRSTASTGLLLGNNTTVTANALSVSGTAGITLGSGAQLNLSGANTIETVAGSNGAGITLGANAHADLGAGTRISSPATSTGFGIALTNGSSLTAHDLDIQYARGVTASGSAALQLSGTNNAIAATGTTANSHGINLTADAVFTLNGPVSVTTVNGHGVNILGNATSTGTLILDSPIQIDATGNGVNSAANANVSLPSGSVVRASGTGINTTATTTLTTDNIVISTLSGGTGAGIRLGTGSVANLGGTTRITSAGDGIVSIASAISIGDGGTAQIRVTDAGSGLNLTGGSIDLKQGSRIETESGAGITSRTSALITASDLTVITNTSQQDLASAIAAVPDLPDVAAIDRPAVGIRLASGVASLTGHTRITSGATGLLIDGLGSSAGATLNGPLTINAGPGGDLNTDANAINVARGGFLDVNGAIDLRVDSVGGGGVGSSRSLVTLNGAGSPIRIALVNPLNAIGDSGTAINDNSETGAMIAQAGTLNATGDLLIDTRQARGYGLWTRDLADSVISVSGNTAIATHGREAFGLRVDNGSITLDGPLSITTGVAPSNADAVDGGGAAAMRVVAGTLEVKGPARIETRGSSVDVGFPVAGQAPVRESAYGVWNTSASFFVPGDAQLTFRGPVEITTAGNGAHGVYSDSNGGRIDFEDAVSIRTSGSTDTVTWQKDATGNPINELIGAWGVNSALGGTTTFKNTLDVATAGDSSGGVRSAGGVVDLQAGASIATAGAGAYGLYATGASTFNGSLQASGPLEIATTGAGSHALVADQSGAINFTSGTTLRVADPAALGILASGHSTITGSGPFDVIANLKADDSARVTLTTTPGSTLTGSMTRSGDATFDLTLQDSLWTMTGSSSLSNLINDPSLIEFSPAVGGVFKTLTVNNYSGDGGIALNTVLEGDSSPSDKLVIDGGTATGSSQLIIRNAADAGGVLGRGALTTGNGINVVDAVNGGTTQAGAFALAGPVYAGPYEYTLHRSSKDTSNQQAWYLRSTVEPDPDPTPDPDPAPTPDPDPAPEPDPEPVVPNFRPQTSLYGAVPALALLYSRSIIDTLHERVGEERRLPGAPVAKQNEQEHGPILGWGRLIYRSGERESGNGPFSESPGYNYDLNAFQVGVDLYRSEATDGTTEQAGVSLAIGNIKGGIDHYTGAAAGEDVLRAISLGGYWTHFAPEGWYLDTVLQLNRFDIEAKPGNIGKLKTDGWGYTASLEGGYPFEAQKDLYIEPQAQIIYSHAQLDDSHDLAADVRFDDMNSLIGRLGVRVAKDWFRQGNDAKTHRTNGWIRPSIWHEFKGQPKTEFSSANGFVPFEADISGTWGEVNLGVDYQADERTTFYVSAGYQRTFDGESHSYEGMLGVKFAF